MTGLELGVTVVNTPVDQTPELVAQLGAVAVVQAGNLRALHLQRVQVGEGGGEGGDEGDGETGQPGEGRHHLSLGQLLAHCFGLGWSHIVHQQLPSMEWISESLSS